MVGDVNQGNKYGVTPLFIALEPTSIVEYLIHHGSDMNKAGKNAKTPLYIASEKGHLSIVECLINHGEDVNNVVNASLLLSSLLLSSLLLSSRLFSRLLTLRLLLFGTYTIISACQASVSSSMRVSISLTTYS